MIDITRANRFSDDLLDDLLRGYFFRPARRDAWTQEIRLEVIENKAAYTVHAERPRVVKDNINIMIDGNRVAIGAELNRAEEGAKTLHRDHYFGHMSREFTLPQDIDQEAAEARYDNGILMLRLPKKATTGTRQLPFSEVPSEVAQSVRCAMNAL